MSWHVRPARPEDIDDFYALAMQTGGGFTNLPQDRDALADRLAWSDASFARSSDGPAHDLYLLFLEEKETGRIGGSALIYGAVGGRCPFYSYKIATIRQDCVALGRSFINRTLNLVNDFEGKSEVGGLFLLPELRSGGWGRLLARSRYMFIAQHRARFTDRVFAELRGYLREDGSSPFWDGLARMFFGMEFQEADRFNAVHGTQFIADLMPRHPIYLNMLSEEARMAIGRVHPTGEPALRMLRAEGFYFDNYVDIFDGGPTVCVATDELRTIAQSRVATVQKRASAENASSQNHWLLAQGQLRDFRCWPAHGTLSADGDYICLQYDVAQAGSEVRYAPL